MDALSTIAGLVLAVVGARLLVDGGTAVAKRFGIPSLVIGATVVAFGTSMPELTVNVHSAMGGNTDLALGNILGSNMFNIAFIIGVSALITPLAVPPPQSGCRRYIGAWDSEFTSRVRSTRSGLDNFFTCSPTNHSRIRPSNTLLGH